MKWKRKSLTDEPYCAIHNVDCPLMDHKGDPMVLNHNPTRYPTGWICPQGVIELAEHQGDAEMYLEENTPDGAGIVVGSQKENVIIRALELEDQDDKANKVRLKGAEMLTLEEIDLVIYCLETHQDDLAESAEEIHEYLTTAWEEETSDSYA